MRERVKAIIVTYNSADCIADCIKSLTDSSERISWNIIIVDNASIDDTLANANAALHGLNCGAEIIRNQENLGYAGGNNVAIKVACSEDSQYSAVLILNPDVTLGPGAVDKLLAVLHRSDEVVAVSPHVIEPGQSQGAAVRLNSLWGWPMRKKFMGDENIVEVDRLHGGCMLVKPDLFKEIGGFDESFFLYWEEIDFCQRARRAGFKLLLCYDVVVAHAGHSSRKQYLPHRIYYMWRNQFYFAFKTFGRMGGLIFLSRRILFSNLFELIGFLWARRSDLAMAGLEGILAGIAGERGRSTNSFANMSIVNHVR